MTIQEHIKELRKILEVFAALVESHTRVLQYEPDNQTARFAVGSYQRKVESIQAAITALAGAVS